MTRPPPRPVAVKRRLYFTMVRHPVKGWTRVGPAYPAREAAKAWLFLVRGAWRCCRVRVAQFTPRWVDGVLDERSTRILDEKFNMDPPRDVPWMAGRAGEETPCKP